jgi:endosialidase-like protein
VRNRLSSVSSCADEKLRPFLELEPAIRVCGELPRKLARFVQKSRDMETRILRVLIILAFVCFALVQNVRAVVPPPDGGYPGNNTAEGQNALLSLTTGVNNTAVGWSSLKSNRNGQLNTAVGAGTLFSNVGASRNTAIGGAALFSDTTGGSNTAVGTLALFHNTISDLNTAIGDSALVSNTVGFENTAVGGWALFNNITGNANVAIGSLAAHVNFTGGGNTAVGRAALFDNQSGNYNIALGFSAGERTTGSNNIAIGDTGMPGESNTIRIGGGFGGPQTAAFIAGISGTAVVGDAVVVDENGQLGTVASSARFKKNIKPIDKTSEAILALSPVSFQYRSDSKGTPQFGLIAEEVAKVNPDLVVRNRNAEIYSVRYEAVNAMLLNEFLKEHKTVQELKANAAKQETIIEQQQKQIEMLTAGLQKVNAQIRIDTPAPQVVVAEQ